MKRRTTPKPAGRSAPVRKKSRSLASTRRPRAARKRVVEPTPAPPQSAAPPANAAEIDRTAESLRGSLEATRAGLSRFLISVQASGLAEAANGYGQLVALLVQQRLWARSHSREELAPLFSDLSRIAGEIHDVLARFGAVLEPLKHLDQVRES